MAKGSETAVAVFRQGFNCAQAALAGAASEGGLSREQAIRVAQAFGGGMCHLDQTCGAVTGALMAIGLSQPARTAADDAPKREVARLTDEFARRFLAKRGSLSCTRILGANLATEEGRRRAATEGLTRAVCPDVVRDAAEILEDLLGRKG
jgi:C_GCAxxG_C_C family probable redox protein